jgi:hypothetical protein
MKSLRRSLLPAIAMSAPLALAAPVAAQTLSNINYVNGFTIPGSTQDLAGAASSFNRLGMFSDIYYDRNRNEWWGLADRGAGGGVLKYDTRMERFTIDINGTTGAISNFQVVQTVLFKSAGVPLNGLAPGAPAALGDQQSSPNSATLGNAFDPEGVVVNPTTGNFLVSDEYGPSLLEFDRSGNLLRRFTPPDNVIPRVGSTVDYISTPATETSGREPNRGYEGLAISPDGKYAYAMLQNGTIQDGWSPAGGGTRGIFTRIVKYDIATGTAVAQYAYQLQMSGQGTGISALVALGNDKFLVLERNNRGVGVGATFATADKSVFQIDLTGATDVTGINLPATAAGSLSFTPVAKSAQIIDLDVNKLAELGNKAPEKMEGLAIGPQLANGLFVILTGTDNDFSVTQNGSGTQFDVYFRFSDADPYAASIQCPIGTTSGCFKTSNSAATTLTNDYSLLPGVLQSYTANINGYVPVVTPEPATLALLAVGLGVVGVGARRRRL